MTDIDPTTPRASLEVRIRGKVSRLELTDSAVSLHSPKSIFQDATVVIPLSAVDSIFIGWKRHTVLLIAGALLLLAGFGRGGTGALVFGAILLALFWFIRPAQFSVRSTGASLGGAPVSESEARTFFDALSKAVADSHR